MRNPTIVASVFGVLLSLASDGWTQEKNIETSSKEPLQIIDECVQAIQQRDFARYVDHLSGTEQKLQAGYALYLLSSTLPQVDANSHQLEPELLLLLRGLGDLIKDHTKNDLLANAGSSSAVEATNYLFLSQLIVPTMTQPVGYSTPQTGSAPNVRDIFRKSAEKALKDPRLFLIATLKEYSRPVQRTGNAPVKDSEIPSLAESAKVYDRKDWTLYTRGDYALAVPMRRESAPQSQSQTKEPPLRIEFQKIDGVWRISHILPMSMFMSSSGTATGLCSGPECNAIAPANVVPPPAPLAAQGDENYLGRTVVIPIRNGTLEDPTQFHAIETALSRARSEGAHAVILEIDCIEAPLDKTVPIMRAVGSLPIHTHAYIVRRAGGAAALLAMSSAKIQLAPQSEISGASQNPKEDDVKLIDEAVAIAQKRGHRAEVARKLVIPAAELKVGDRLIAAVGVPLKLDTKQATAVADREVPLYAARLQPNVSEVIDREELSRNVVRLKLERKEK